MNLISKALFVLVCFAGGATASTQVTSYSKVLGFTTAELCYLDGTVNDTYAPLVQSELQRRDAVCTAALTENGQQALERRAKYANARAVIRANAQSADEYYRRQVNQMAYCDSSRGQVPGCTATH